MENALCRTACTAKEVMLEGIVRNGGERPKGAKQQDLRLKSFLKTLLYTNLFVKTISFNIP
jgi:hypothetical protein